MVGDDEVNAQGPRLRRRFVGADAAVHRHDQPGALRMQPFDGLRLETVAVLVAVRHEVRDLAADELDRAAQDDRGGNAVHVVVAVHDNRLASRDRRQQPIDRRAHVGQEKRIMELAQVGREKAAGLGRVVQPTLTQEARDDRRYTHRRGDLANHLRVNGHVLPDAALHQSFIPGAFAPAASPGRSLAWTPALRAARDVTSPDSEELAIGSSFLGPVVPVEPVVPEFVSSNE